MRREHAVLGELEPQPLVVAPRSLDQVHRAEVVGNDKPADGRVVAVELVAVRDLGRVDVVANEDLLRDVDVFRPLAHWSSCRLGDRVVAGYQPLV